MKFISLFFYNQDDIDDKDENENNNENDHNDDNNNNNNDGYDNYNGNNDDDDNNNSNNNDDDDVDSINIVTPALKIPNSKRLKLTPVPNRSSSRLSTNGNQSPDLSYIHAGNNIYSTDCCHIIFHHTYFLNRMAISLCSTT